MQRILALICLTIGTKAAACEAPVIVVGADEQPHYISPQRDALTGIEARFGAPAVPGSTLVVDARTRNGWWVSPQSSLTPAEMALLAGADTSRGFRYRGPDGCAPPDLPLDPELPVSGPALPRLLPDPDTPGTPPEDLFPDQPDLAVQPRSGLWQARLGQTRLQGCPAAMAQSFPKSPGALPPEWRKPRPLTFRRPFHPDQLALSKTLTANGLGQVAWTPSGKNAWQAEVMPQIFAQIPATQGGGSRMVWTLTVKDPDRIDHSVVLDIVLPAAAAQVLGSTKCRMITDNQWLRTGD